MSPEIEALARHVVTLPGWRWLPGMLARYGGGSAWYRLTEVDGHARYRPPDPRDAWPDLTDPATLGCLLQLVREARGDRGWLPACLDAEDEAWVVDSPSRTRQTRRESYAAALVAALEAAPRRGDS